MMEFVLLAFFAAQSTAEPGAGVPTAQAAPAAPARTAKSLAKNVEIKSDRAQAERKKRQVIYYGGVRVDRGPTHIKCDKLIAYVSQDDSGFTRLECIGSAEATDGDKWAKGDRADFDNLSGVLQVTGNPEARQGNHHMWGTKVTIYVGKDLIEVEGARTIFDTSDKKPSASEAGKPK